MPVPRPPFKLTCQKCGWSRIIEMRRDVVFDVRELPEQVCPKCGSDQLHESELGTLSALLRRLMR
jgi:predicted nucleic-acid-binding Zn-ribbon protein